MVFEPGRLGGLLELWIDNGRIVRPARHFIGKIIDKTIPGSCRRLKNKFTVLAADAQGTDVSYPGFCR